MAELVGQYKFMHVDKPQLNEELLIKSHDRSDVMAYTLVNAPLIGLAGLVTGAQEAYYAFTAMKPEVIRNTGRQASIILGIIGRKTLLATTLGAVFCATEATLENSRGHSITNGMAAGAAAGFVFSMLPPKPLPQPIAWPLAFAAVVATSDLVSEYIPAALQQYRNWGPVVGRPNWNDPEPPRPPIYDTGSSARPSPGQFWRGS